MTRALLGRMCITPGPTQYLYVADAFPGRIYKLIAGRQGARHGSVAPANSSSNSVGFTQIACPSENELYVAELLNWRAQKLILHPR